jgi:hypothetical protein
LVAVELVEEEATPTAQVVATELQAQTREAAVAAVQLYPAALPWVVMVAPVAMASRLSKHGKHHENIWEILVW